MSNERTVQVTQRMFKKNLIRNQDLKDNWDTTEKCLDLVKNHVNNLDIKYCNKINHLEKLLKVIGERLA